MFVPVLFSKRHYHDTGKEFSFFKYDSYNKFLDNFNSNVSEFNYLKNNIECYIIYPDLNISAKEYIPK